MKQQQPGWAEEGSGEAAVGEEEEAVSGEGERATSQDWRGGALKSFN